MAFIPLAITTTLAIIKSNIRSRSSTISPQISQMIELQLDDIVQDALSFVVGLVRKVDKDFNDLYWTVEAAVAPSAVNSLQSFDISILDLYDAASISVYNSTDDRIDIIPTKLFDDFRKRYSTALFARIVNAGGANGKLVIQCSSTPATSDITYLRNPKKATADATKIDAPEHVIPYVENVAIMNVFSKAKAEIPREITNAVLAFINSHTAGIGIKAQVNA